MDRFYEILEEKGGQAQEPYTSYNKKIWVFCGKYTDSGKPHIWHVTPGSIIAGTWCSWCSGRHYEVVSEKYYQAIRKRGGYPIQPYINKDGKSGIICAKGHEFYSNSGSIIQGHWCMKCAGICPEEAGREFRDFVESKGGEVLGEYSNNRTHIAINCGRGHVWYPTPSSVMHHRSWCSFYANNAPEQGLEAFMTIIKSRKAQLFGNYVNARTNMLIVCQKGHGWEATQSNIVKGRWCPYCGIRSHGELAIKNFLEEQQILYSREVKFLETHLRRYDFYLPEYRLIIEFDGLQHFESIPFWNSNIEDQRKSDNEKDEFAYQNTLHMIRIPYHQMKSVPEIILEAIGIVSSTFKIRLTPIGSDYYLTSGKSGITGWLI